MGAADPTKGITTMTDHDVSDFEPPHASSPSDLVLTELQLYGYRPFQGDPDPRPLPEAKVIGGAVADIFDALIATLQDTRLEPDLTDLLWSTVNLFHRAADRVERELDDNETASASPVRGSAALREIIAGAKDLLANYEKAQAEETLRTAAKRLTIWLKDNAELPSSASRRVHDSLLSTTRAAHWKTIYATISRRGGWPNLDYAHQLSHRHGGCDDYCHHVEP
jgi:hypothetical protein